VLALAGAICALALSAPGALASTLTFTGGAMTVNGASGSSQNWGFEESAPSQVDGYLYSDPVTYTAGGDPAPGCKDVDGGAGSPTLGAVDTDGTAWVVRCTGVTKVVTTSGGSGSSIDALGLTAIPIDATGGVGNDALRGGAVNDTLTGGDGNDTLEGRAGDDAIDGGNGNDQLYGDYQSCDTCIPAGKDIMRGGNGIDQMRGGGNDDQIDSGAGADTVAGNAGNDSINSGDGNDNVDGGDGNDTIATGAGDDQVSGGNGDDVITAGDGNDQIDSGSGTDSVDAGAGDDFVNELTDGYPDSVKGGPGHDGVLYVTSNNSSVNDSVTSSFDDQANDGFHNLSGSASPDDPNNNFGSDVESLYLIANDTPLTATGSPAANEFDVWCCDGADNVDPGPGPDVVRTWGGPDTINAVDGYPDFVNCGSGVDTAVLDQFDTQVACENVTVRQVPSAYDIAEDTPPVVAWTSPTPSRLLPSSAKSRFEAMATDDRGVAKVVFLVGSREVCTDTTAPYQCDYLPKAADQGRNTLVAVAYDTAGQTATALNTATVPRFTARGMRSTTRPRKDTTAPYKFVTAGRLLIPSNLTPAEACVGGVVSVQFRAGRNTISNRRVPLAANCTFKSEVTFQKPERLKATAKTLEVLTRFTGNGVVSPRSAARERVTVRD
jgi:hypothetical protein